jgi:Spy/CpxP family protein refolding chaperone
MLNKTLSFVLLFALVMTPALVMGQELPPGKWWRNPVVAGQLDLSEEQINQMDEQFNKNGGKLIGLKSAVKQEQFELGVLLESKALDERAIMKQLEKLGKKKSALQEEFMLMVIETRKIIGYENFRTLKAHMEKKAIRKVRRFMGEQGMKQHHKGHPAPKHKSTN